MSEVAQDPRLIAALGGVNAQGYADMLVKQRQLARQQQLAQMLMQQTVTPNQNEVVDGRVVKYGIGQGLTKLAQALVTRNMNDRNDQTAADLGQQQAQLYSQALQQSLAAQKAQLFGGQSVPSAAPASAPAVDNSGAPASGGQPTSVPPPTDPQSPVAQSQDGGYGSFSPDHFMGGAQPSAPAAGPQPSPQALAAQLSGNPMPQPASGGYGPGTLDPRNVASVGLDMSVSPFFGDAGKEMFKLGMSNMMPTEQARNNAYMGITPEQARANAMGAAYKNSLISFKPGESWYSPIDGKGGFTPAIPANAQPDQPYNPMANGGRMGPVSSVVGAQRVEQGNANAKSFGESGGNLQNTLVDAVDPATGQHYKIPYKDAVSLNNTGNAPVDAASAALIAKDAASRGVHDVNVNWQAQPNPPALGSAVPRGGVPTGLPLAQTKNIETDVETGRKALTDAATFSQNAGTYEQGLNQILKLATEHPEAFGAGAEGFAKFKSYLSNIPGIDLNGTKTVQDVVSKLSAQIAGGGRTDADLSNKLAALPGAEKTADAVKEVVPSLIAQLHQGMARTVVLQHAKDAAGGDNRAVNGAAIQFDQLASPQLIEQGRQLTQLSNASGANVKGTPANRALASFMSQLPPGTIDRIKKLNDMGAF